MEIFFTFLKTFLVGGAVCVIAQLLIDLTKLTPARILVSYVICGVFLGSVGLFEPLHKFAGCGISVPLIGFGGAVAKGVKEAIQKDGFVGIFTGGLTATSAGITAALVFGYLVAVFFKGRPKQM